MDNSLTDFVNVVHPLSDVQKEMLKSMDFSKLEERIVAHLVDAGHTIVVGIDTCRAQHRDISTVAVMDMKRGQTPTIVILDEIEGGREQALKLQKLMEQINDERRLVGRSMEQIIHDDLFDMEIGVYEGMRIVESPEMLWPEKTEPEKALLKNPHPKSKAPLPFYLNRRRF